MLCEDKVYDLEKIHSLNREKIKSDPIRPLRKSKRIKFGENTEESCTQSLIELNTIK